MVAACGYRYAGEPQRPQTRTRAKPSQGRAPVRAPVRARARASALPSPAQPCPAFRLVVVFVFRCLSHDKARLATRCVVEADARQQQRQQQLATCNRQLCSSVAAFPSQFVWLFDGIMSTRLINTRGRERGARGGGSNGATRGGMRQPADLHFS